MNTHSRPSRGSTASAVRTGMGLALQRRAARVAPGLQAARSTLAARLRRRPLPANARAIAAGSGNAPRSANGSAGTRCGSSTADMRQRAERQAEADRRIARHQEQPAAPQLPDLADPAAARLRVPALHRQHVAGRRRELPLELAHDAGALVRIVDLGIARVDVVRQRAFLEHPLGGILEGRQHVLGGDAEPAGEALGEALRVVGRVGRIVAGSSGAISAAFRQIGLPSLRQIQRERPARQRLARIPFALAVMQEARPGAKRSRSRRISSSARTRLVGPTAAVFHSAAW